ncbi:MAG: radical SAM protein [Candidatus Omnitrophica bacterium]|nr:radical SAM protein [Candidatus Omnitrophota bacterium]MCF7877135.1 radical SAM protein [Candidatus Omnitrophota bacterium]MCF7892465.1 radical SAM protein [Candidatus Omnitrophota bacterium]MCF7895690.1 radical SAM protein [Candidatus Omnitrophota bacterium]MCF7898030.1 radical SAM protein [Candidatus Omnitrophota bacterium]
MEYFYGPVPSRRLGFSLGVDLTPKKSCSFNCIYCQLQIVAEPRMKRSFFIDFAKFKDEFRAVLSKNPKIDYITLSGSGEPTLHKDLGKIIKALKEISDYQYPVAVITNASLLQRKKVRDELKEADLIIPSLDAPTAEIFKKINRPHPKINFYKIKKGCIKLRREFKGKIWLEIMLIKGVNDSLDSAHKFRKVIKRIKPDRVQLNLPVRPSAEENLVPDLKQVEKITEIIGQDVEVVAAFPKNKKLKQAKIREEEVLSYLRRRPATIDDLSSFLGINISELLKYLTQLKDKKKVKVKSEEGIKYFLIND